jgi:hypothetical protein
VRWIRLTVKKCGMTKKRADSTKSGSGSRTATTKLIYRSTQVATRRNVAAVVDLIVETAASCAKAMVRVRPAGRWPGQVFSINDRILVARDSTANGLVIISIPGGRKPDAMAALSA